MPDRVSVQRNDTNLVGRLLIVVPYLLMQGVYCSIALDTNERATPRDCSLLFSSCGELRVTDTGNEGCSLYLAAAKGSDCVSNDRHVLDCLVSVTGRVCRVIFLVSETYPAVSTGRYLHGRKIATIIDQTASPVDIRMRQASALSSVSKVEEEFAPQANSSYHSHAHVQFYGILGGFSLVACAFICPCLQPKRKETSKEFEKDKALPSNCASLEGSSLSKPLPGFASDASISVLPKSTGCMSFTMADIARITRNFSASNVIGHGGFGTVYKGNLGDGNLVAIKRGKKPYALKVLQNEVTMLSKIDHLNLVKLLGYLEDDQEHILIVEYVSNGNLREHLDGRHGVTLNLATRLDIAIDVAHALTYLHLYAEKPIIHRDVKSSNILVTDKFRAKVADFGVSTTGPTEVGETHVSTLVRGHADYVDPEYLQTLKITTKSDVYSYGVLLIEIFSGRRPFELKRPSNERVTIKWAAHKIIEGNATEILDPKLELTPAASIAIGRLMDLAVQCLAPTRKYRPTMQEVAAVLWDIRKDYGNSSQAPTPTRASVDLLPC
ncbi:hypothetical protein O6H91_11G053100 [Diphasiastrum complanatum]|uniref:Uncharacterized protein n=4 Tax=Diphasiastrum complanatum TaxID=34168 RepID=A0ACC2C993_DIPCM|nr:hypothetical protein O6H91_11G053100 [Diphasiastrum complanatum]